MDDRTFLNHLNEVTESTLELTLKLCSNHLSKNVVYTIKPNQISFSNHLDEEETENLKHRIQELNKEWTLNEVRNRLIMNGRVPVWINVSVIKSTKSKTVIELFTSRRFRKDIAELYHLQDNYPPFHATVPMPPFHHGKAKFDINWQNQTWKRGWHKFMWKLRNKIKY